MSAQEQIQKLESLLARVQSRAAEPRAKGGSPIAAAASAPAMRVPPAAPSAPAVAPRAAQTSAPPPTNAFTADEEAAVAEAYDAEVEVSAEVVEVDIDIDEAGMEEGAAEERPELEVMGEEETEELEASPPPRPANEIEEPAPTSSPRAIEQAAAESAPRHTPPPESGKLPAASSAPPAARPSSFPPPRAPSIPASAISEPPPSLEGHTLIGGWREPGLGGAPAPQGSPLGVRVPAPGAGAPPPAQGSPVSTPPQPFVGASPGATGDFAGPKPARKPQAVGSLPAEAGPEVTKPELAAEARVASFTGAPPAFAPATFGELLDATLAL